MRSIQGIKNLALAVTAMVTLDSCVGPNIGAVGPYTATEGRVGHFTPPYGLKPDGPTRTTSESFNGRTFTEHTAHVSNRSGGSGIVTVQEQFYPDGGIEGLAVFKPDGKDITNLQEVQEVFRYNPRGPTDHGRINYFKNNNGGVTAVKSTPEGVFATETLPKIPKL